MHPLSFLFAFVTFGFLSVSIYYHQPNVGNLIITSSKCGIQNLTLSLIQAPSVGYFVTLNGSTIYNNADYLSTQLWYNSMVKAVCKTGAQSNLIVNGSGVNGFIVNHNESTLIAGNVNFGGGNAANVFYVDWTSQNGFLQGYFPVPFYVNKGGTSKTSLTSNYYLTANSTAFYPAFPTSAVATTTPSIAKDYIPVAEGGQSYWRALSTVFNITLPPNPFPVSKGGTGRTSYDVEGGCLMQGDGTNPVECVIPVYNTVISVGAPNFTIPYATGDGSYMWVTQQQFPQYIDTSLSAESGQLPISIGGGLYKWENKGETSPVTSISATTGPELQGAVNTKGDTQFQIFLDANSGTNTVEGSLSIKIVDATTALKAGLIPVSYTSGQYAWDSNGQVLRYYAKGNFYPVGSPHGSLPPFYNYYTVERFMGSPVVEFCLDANVPYNNYWSIGSQGSSVWNYFPIATMFEDSPWAYPNGTAISPIFQSTYQNGEDPISQYVFNSFFSFCYPISATCNDPYFRLYCVACADQVFPADADFLPGNVPITPDDTSANALTGATVCFKYVGQNGYA